MIPIAAMLGGIVIGFLTVVGDLLNVAGSSTGIMLSISILYGYYEKIRPTEKFITDFWFIPLFVLIIYPFRYNPSKNISTLQKF